MASKYRLNVYKSREPNRELPWSWAIIPSSAWWGDPRKVELGYMAFYRRDQCADWRSAMYAGYLALEAMQKRGEGNAQHPIGTQDL